MFGQPKRINELNLALSGDESGFSTVGEKHAKVLLLFVLPRPVNLMRINPITHFFSCIALTAVNILLQHMQHRLAEKGRLKKHKLSRKV